MTRFKLDDKLKADTHHICDLGLSQLLLMDNALYPWVIMVPKVVGASELIDLSEGNRKILMEEICVVSEAMQSIFKPDKLNVAALGNMVSQLHIHIIARFKSDKAWPNPIWGNGREFYSGEEVERIKNNLLKSSLFSGQGHHK